MGATVNFRLIRIMESRVHRKFENPSGSIRRTPKPLHLSPISRLSFSVLLSCLPVRMSIHANFSLAPPALPNRVAAV
ncbi:hypothetical protein CMEL01_13766 [Colletotrichum melonis]|uniref:Uncharacterized protein n=1 Tax=Colletotrichum melonis TaxID=1209925 RepID=A0AAI9UQ71_9PEZI|nr:hypothetical protein CMEL01_13766 [Colletotrichum melonis]